jgi:hypothetical protein
MLDFEKGIFWIWEQWLTSVITVTLEVEIGKIVDQGQSRPDLIFTNKQGMVATLETQVGGSPSKTTLCQK